MLPEDRMLPRLRFAWTPSSSTQLGGLRYDGQDLDFADVDGILSRAWSVPVAAEDFASADGRYICAEWNALLMAWLHAMPCTVRKYRGSSGTGSSFCRIRTMWVSTVRVVG